MTSQHRTLLTDVRVKAKKKRNKRKVIRKIQWRKLKSVEEREAFVSKAREQFA